MTYTFKNRTYQHTKEKNVIIPSEMWVTEAYEKLYKKYQEQSTWYGDYTSRMFTVLEAGSLNNRLHLHSLIKRDETKGSKENNWLYNINSWWFNGEFNRGKFSGGYGAYHPQDIRNISGCCEYITKATSYINKDNNKQNSKFFPKFWDTRGVKNEI